MFNLPPWCGQWILDICLPYKYFSLSGKEWRAAAFKSVLNDKNIIVLLFLRSPLTTLMAWVVRPSVCFGVTGFDLGLTNQERHLSLYMNKANIYTEARCLVSICNQ